MANQLRVEITQIGNDARSGQILVTLPDSEVKTKSWLSFVGEVALSAVLKSLNAVDRELNRLDFYENELEWLRDETFIAQSRDRYYYSANLWKHIGRCV